MRLAARARRLPAPSPPVGVSAPQCSRAATQWPARPPRSHAALSPDEHLHARERPVGPRRQQCRQLRVERSQLPFWASSSVQQAGCTSMAGSRNPNRSTSQPEKH
eukprot:scaffold31493_cov101-Isochrysis_galbana.AAC.4